MAADAAEVFLSYASKDAATADAVVAALASVGVRVWRDKTHIVGGQKYKASIVGGLRAAKVVLLLCSPHSLASENVAAELNMAWDDFDKKPVLQLWLVDRAGCPIPDELLMTLSLSRQYLRYHGRAEGEWLPDVLAALSTFGVSSRVAVVVPRPAELYFRGGPTHNLPKQECHAGEKVGIGVKEEETSPEERKQLVNRVQSRRAESVGELWREYVTLVPADRRPYYEAIAERVAKQSSDPRFNIVLIGPLGLQLPLVNRLIGCSLDLPSTATLPPQGLIVRGGKRVFASVRFADRSLVGPPPKDWPEGVQRMYATRPEGIRPNLEVSPDQLATLFVDLPADSSSPIDVASLITPSGFLQEGMSITLTVNPDASEAYREVLDYADAAVFTADATEGLRPRDLTFLTREVKGRGLSPCRVALFVDTPVDRPRAPAVGLDTLTRVYHLTGRNNDLPRLSADLRLDAADRVNVKCRNAVTLLLIDAEKLLGPKPKPAVKAVIDAAREMLAELPPVAGGVE